MPAGTELVWPLSAPTRALSKTCPPMPLTLQHGTFVIKNRIVVRTTLPVKPSGRCSKQEASVTVKLGRAGCKLKKNALQMQSRACAQAASKHGKAQQGAHCGAHPDLSGHRPHPALASGDRRAARDFRGAEEESQRGAGDGYRPQFIDKLSRLFLTVNSVH
jgi:hypothetical protein